MILRKQDIHMLKNETALISNHIQKSTQNYLTILRPETVKLLEENLHIHQANDFSYMTQKALATKAKINKWDFIKL
jgi:hypothetical protein